MKASLDAKEFARKQSAFRNLKVAARNTVPPTSSDRLTAYYNDLGAKKAKLEAERKKAETATILSHHALFR